MDKPLFSIVMPVYNQQKFISDAILSVINQTFQSWELLIIDNNSFDGTINSALEFKDPRIKITSIENYGVIAKSRNQAIRESLGEYIAFLDSDDTWAPGKLEAVRKNLNGQPILVYHSVDLVSEDGVKQSEIRSREIAKPAFEDLLINGNPIVNSSVVVTRKSLFDVGLLNESSELIGVEDYNLWLKLSLSDIVFVRIPHILGSYRIHGASTTSHTVIFGVPTKAFKGLEDRISKELLSFIQSRFWEIEAKTKFRERNFLLASETFEKAAKIVNRFRRLKMSTYLFLSRFMSLFFTK